ncbi:MAG TPA: response regulator transcription factor [Solirubrobacteraceae bacterium]|nr:response regulator transcription factor [Solirubrobacteraceae bacterium]
MRVLVVEDHAELAETIANGLRREGMAVDIANDGAQALYNAQIYEYDVLVLDRDLPKLHGDEVTARMIEAGARPRILMLTASGEVQDRVEGLSIGADDYLTKPFAFAELVARVRALARRSQPALAPVLEAGDVQLDPGRRLVTRDGERLDLSAKEFTVLELLMSAGGAVLQTEEILARAWDEAADPFSNVVKVTISRLRRKLGDPPLIETVPGGGYRI